MRNLKLLNKSAALVVFSILVAITSSAPYLYGFIFPKEGLNFLGRSVVNAADTYPLLANIESAKQGNIILPNLYTSESQTPFMIRPTYLVLGLLVRILHVESLAIYHIGKFVFTIIFVLVLWKFIDILRHTGSKKWFTMFIVMFSSGFGFFVRDGLPLSIDLWVPESNTFFALLESPHFISAQIFLITSVYFLYRYVKQPKRSYLLLSSIFSTLLILEHPFMIPFVVLFFLVVMLFISRQESSELPKNLMLVLLFPILATVIIYYLYSISLSAKLMNSQNVLKTPTIVNVLSGYGLLFIFAVFGVAKLKIRKNGNKLLLVWAVLAFFLMYSPLTFQRRLVEGLHIPVSLLATGGILYFLSSVKNKTQKFAVTLVLFGSLIITNIYNLSHMVASFASDIRSNSYYKYHIHPADLEAMRWLRENAKNEDVILANFFLSNIMPGITGRFVYHGHMIQTYKVEEKGRAFEEFMETSDSKFRNQFIREHKIAFIFLGKDDPFGGSLRSLENEINARRVWTKNGVTILKIKKEE